LSLRVISIALCLWFLSGCALDNSVQKEGKNLARLLTNSRANLLEKIKSENGTLNVLTNQTAEFFNPYKSFKLVKKRRQKEQTEIPGFDMSKDLDFTLEFNIRRGEEFRKSFFLGLGLPTGRYNVLIIDDFSPIFPDDVAYLQPDIIQATAFLKEGNLKNFEEGKSQFTSPLVTGVKTYPEYTAHHAPMGYAKESFAMPFAIDPNLTFFNTLAWEVFQHMRQIALKDDPDLVDTRFPKALTPAQLKGKAFLDFLKKWRLNYYYPDPNSGEVTTAKLGLSFYCYLLYLFEPDLYRELLEVPKSTKIIPAVKAIKKILGDFSSVLKPVSSMEALVSKVVEDTVLAEPPEGMTFPDFYSFKSFPPDSTILDAPSRISFGFIPESEFLKRYEKQAFLDKNRKVLEEIKEQAENERKIREERAKRRNAKRKGRSKKGEEEEEESKEEEEEEEEPERPKYYNINQLKGFIPGFTVSRRIYGAIPYNASSQVKSLALFTALLQKPPQMALSMEPNYLRSFQREIEPKLYVSQVEIDRRGKQKMSKDKYPVQAFSSSNEILADFIPMLNPHYQKYIPYLMKKRRL